MFLPHLLGLHGLAGSGKDTAADFLVQEHGYIKIAFGDHLKRVTHSMYPLIPDTYLWGPSEFRGKPILSYPTERKTWDHCKHEIDDYVECGLELTPTFHKAGSKSFITFECPKHGKVQFYLTVRYLLQKLGTDFGRSMYEDTWTEQVFLNIENLKRQDFSIYLPHEGIKLSTIKKIKTKFVITDVRYVDGNEGLGIRERGGYLIKLLRGEPLPGSVGKHESETVSKHLPNEWFDGVVDNREVEIEEMKIRLLKVISSLESCNPAT